MQQLCNYWAWQHVGAVAVRQSSPVSEDRRHTAAGRALATGQQQAHHAGLERQQQQDSEIGT